MPTPVEVSHIKRSAIGIEGLGGTWRERPWYMSARNVIWEIERPDSERQWDFFVVIGRESVPITAVSTGGRKTLGAAGNAHVLLALPEWRPEQPIPS